MDRSLRRTSSSTLVVGGGQVEPSQRRTSSSSLVVGGGLMDPLQRCTSWSIAGDGGALPASRILLDRRRQLEDGDLAEPSVRLASSFLAGLV